MMQAFVPGEVVKSKLGTKFIVLSLTDAESSNGKLELVYAAYNMNLKQETTLRVSSLMPSNFTLVPEEMLSDDEKSIACNLARLDIE